jgi:S-adenosylmethionine-diacylgycerolhomoserine-N-methlytransferase
MNHAELMNRIYRFQRYFYDATRVLFLPGRDALIDAVRIEPGMTVLEMGCGTGRNLIKLARNHKDVHFFGVDISNEMLRTARKKIRAAGLEHCITVEESPAEQVHHRKTFGLEAPFDAVIFSYSLSMMPTFTEALKAARATVDPAGALYAVDFWDAKQWPWPARPLLAQWLSLFHVRFDTGIHCEIRRAFPDTEIRAIKGRYAFMAAPRRGH